MYPRGRPTHAPCCSTNLPEHGLPNPSVTQTGVRLHCLEPPTLGKIRKLEFIQSKAARFGTHRYDRTTSVTGLKMSLYWPTLESRRNYRDCLMGYKIHHGLIHISFPDSVSQNQRLGRHDHQVAYRLICPRVEGYRHSFYVPHDSTLERSACLCSNCHNPPSLPETGHVQPVWSGHSIDTPKDVLYVLTCTLHPCFYLLYVF